jgi:hypothetical protein
MGYILKGLMALVVVTLTQPGGESGPAPRKVRLAEKRNRTVRLSVPAGGAVRFYTNDPSDGESLGLRLAVNGRAARPVKYESFGKGTVGYTFKARRPGKYRLAMTRVLSNVPPPNEQETELGRATTTVILTVKR